MNIFVLDQDPYKAAEYHCDKHVVKMVLETAQLLSTVTGVGYRPTHFNHPCTVWARESTGNFQWLYDLGLALGKEYNRRYGRRHKSSLIIAEQWPPPATVPQGPQTPFALAMPDQYKQECPVASYRAYYLGEKSRMLKYTNRDTPEWLVSANALCYN
jgi:hypothetical protein